MVLESGCAVLPIHLDGLSQALPIGARRPHPGGRIRIVVGATIEPSRWADTPNDRDGRTQVAESLLEEIRRLGERP